MTNLGNWLLWVLIICTVGASLFFTINVYEFKTSLRNSTSNLRIPSGQQVVVYRVMDGEDILVLWNGERIRVHLLGIKTPDPNQSDNRVQVFGKMAASFLRDKYLGKTVRIVYKDFKTTQEKNPLRRRLLAYVFDKKKDLGLSMVQQGVAFVFEKYSFSRMKSYLQTEQEAIRLKKGFWGVAKIRERYLKQKSVWRSKQR